MEFSWETVAGILGILLGGGGIGGFFTWKYTKRKAKAEAVSEEASAAKELQDVYQQLISDIKTDRDEQKAYISELKDDRQHLRMERDELTSRIDKMEDEQRTMKNEIADNARKVEAMRPFVCGDLACKKRKRITIEECELKKETKKKTTPKK